MRTSKKKVSLVFNVFLFAAILLIPATAFNANAQEEYMEKKNDDYGKYDNDYNDNYQYNKDDHQKYYDTDLKKSYNTDYYKPHNEKKKDPIVTIKKELFICDEVVDPGLFEGQFFFDCRISGTDLPLSPTSERYIECNDSICPQIDESTFSAFIHKKTALVEDLSSEGKSTNLNKFHYIVSEDEVDDRNGFDDGQCGSDFDEYVSFTRFLEPLELTFHYDICVVYEGDCEGYISVGERKTCTIKNYIIGGFVTTESPR